VTSIAVRAAMSSDRQVVVVLRRAFLVLAAAGVVATAVELAMLRHWGSFARNVPWAVVAITAIAVSALAGYPSRWTIRFARVSAAVVTAATVYGIVQHVIANHEAGALDARYGDTWDSMSTWAQWWAAATESVGPSPPLAPAALALGGVCLWLATIGLTAHRWTDSPGPMPTAKADTSRAALSDDRNPPSTETPSVSGLDRRRR
jgi:hypothetical protein